MKSDEERSEGKQWLGRDPVDRRKRKGVCRHSSA